MVSRTVTVGGTQAADVVDINWSRTEGDTIGSAIITVANSQTNRDLFESGADVVIAREDQSNPGTYIDRWAGEVIGTPSNQEQSNLVLDVEAETKLGQAEYGKVSRPFIETDTGEIIRQAVNKKVDPYLRPEFIHRGESLTGWSGDPPLFETADIDSKGLNNFGSNLLFAGWYENADGDYDIEYTNVPAAAVPGRRLLRFETRMLVNNRGNVFTASIELVDGDGISYVWDVDVPAYAGFKTYELPVEDATVTDTGGSTKLTYTFSIDGSLPEARAAVIDMARTVPFDLQDRDTALSTSGVEDSGRTITRRFDNMSILEVAKTLATEDGAVVYVDTNDVLHFESAGDTHVDPSLNLTKSGSAPIVNVDVDRDFDVRNVVTIQGHGEIRGTFEDSASVDFYNTEAPKEEPIIDESLRTNDQLETRAVGYLNEHAWDDSAIEVTVADTAWLDAEIGEAIDITWPPEDIDGTFVIDKIATTSEGYIVIGVTGNTTA